MYQLKKLFVTASLALLLSRLASATSAPAPTAPEAAPGALPTQGAEATPGGAPPAPGATPAGMPKASQASREYHLKGAFLRYVAKYVIWPSSALQGNTINLCVLGQVPVFEGINSINGKIVNDRAIQVTKILNIADAKTSQCQVVFVAKTETDDIGKIITAVKDIPILGFGDMDTYAQAGGAMNFYIANNHLAIMTNMPAVEQAKLSIDPQMLKLVTFVPGSAPKTAEPAAAPTTTPATSAPAPAPATSAPAPATSAPAPAAPAATGTPH